MVLVNKKCSNFFFLLKNIWFGFTSTFLVLLHSCLMHCNLTRSPDPEFQLLPLTGYVTLDELFSLTEPTKWKY